MHNAATGSALPVSPDRVPGRSGQTTAFHVDGRHRTVVAEVQRQISRWLRSWAPTGFDADAFNAGMCDVGGGIEALSDAGSSDTGIVTHRWRLRRVPGIGSVTVTVRSQELGRAWILIESTTQPTPARSGNRRLPDPPRSPVPTTPACTPADLVRYIVDALDARDGLAHLTARPRGVATNEDTRALVDAILDHERRLPLLVAADAPTARRAEWERCVVRFMAKAVGAVSCYALMPAAMTAFTRITAFDAASACADGSLLVYLTADKNASRHLQPRPDGELRFDAASPATDTLEPNSLEPVSGLFTAAAVWEAAMCAPTPPLLIGVPSILGQTHGGDANFEDDPAKVRELLVEADNRAFRAQREAASLAAQLADLRTQRARSVEGR